MPETRRPRSPLFLFGCVVEGGLGVVGAVLVTWLNPDAWRLAGLTPAGVLVGLAATVPLLALPVWVARSTWPPVAGIRNVLEQRLLPALAGPVGRVAVLCALAGVGEELLFRAWLQDWLAGHWGWLPALAVASLAFGLCHAVSPAYAVMATCMGVYLGLEFHLAGSVTAVAVTHALYDFLAIRILLRAWQGRTAGRAG